MNNWINIISFVYPHEAHIAKAKLESEGIETIIQDELTTQVNNFYSNAIGGVKILVKKSDYKRAYDILKQSRIIIEGKEEPTPTESETKKKLFTAKFVYYFSVTIAIIAIGAIIISILSLPSTREKLTRTSWCFNAMYYDDYEFFPNTIKPENNNNNSSVQVTWVGDCTEFITFMENGTVLLPGFDTKIIRAQWKLENKKLTLWPENNDLTLVNKTKENVISGQEPLENIYYGIYKVEFENITLILENENGIIYATR